MKINLIRKKGKFNFEATNENGFQLLMDANPAIGGEGNGFRPMETLLAGLGGCSGIDVVNILAKQQEPLEGIRIAIDARRREKEIPAIFEQVHVHFILEGTLQESKVKRALQMTFDKYCSVAHILGKSAEIHFTYEIHSKK